MMGIYKEKIDRLPPNPGIYLFKDERGTILFGKAGSIRKRVSSCFQRLSEKDAKTLSNDEARTNFLAFWWRKGYKETKCSCIE